MDSIFDKVKETVSIADVAERFGVKLDRRDKALCPFHKEDTPSFSVKKSENIFKCFGCGESGDAIDFVAKLKGVGGLEAAKLLAEMYGISETVPHGAKNAGNVPETPSKSRREINAEHCAGVKDYITGCEANIGRTDYFKKRGLSEAMIKHFRLGYDPKKRCVVIPYSSELGYYQTRSVDAKEFRKPPTAQAGQEPLFNPAVLLKNGYVFVVESPICAMSIMQSGGLAAALCGATGGQKLIRELKSKKTKCTFILALDNDKPGRSAEQDLANELYELNVKFIKYNIAGKFNDPNELLMQDPQALTANVKAAVAAARKEFSKLKKLFTAQELQGKTIKPIRWIVRELLPEGVTLVCAPSKYGKSWMMMQLCTAVAEGKPFLGFDTVQCDCAYFSLEDSERRFQSRLNIILKEKDAPPNFYGSIECSAMNGGLFQELEELVETYPKIGLIVIDTFQRVRQGAGKTESAYAADYREIGEFKAFSEKHNIGIILVHHLRKQIDDSDIFNMINGSMGLMGASDTTWILAKKKRQELNTAFVATGRDVADINLVLYLDRSSFHWEVIGSADDQARLEAKREYEENPVIRTIKSLTEKHQEGWIGNCTDLKCKIYEETGQLYTKSVESIGKVISNYKDRLLYDGIIHSEARGKRHQLQKKSNTLLRYTECGDD